MKPSLSFTSLLDNFKKKVSVMLLLLAFAHLGCQARVKYVTTDLNMRYGPGVRHGIICTLPKGTPVAIDEDCDCKWIVVEYMGRIGYESTRYLSPSLPSFTKGKGGRTVRNSRHRGSMPYNGRVRYYTNVEGYRVQAPTYYRTAPNGATALCHDGTYSFSRNSRGTCSHYGGVRQWLR